VTLEPAPALRLAMLRVLIGGFSLGYVVGRLPALLGVMRFRESQFRPVGPVALLEAPLPPWVVVVTLVATVVLGVAFCAGWRFRITGPAFAVLLTWVLSYRNSWGMVFHTENLAVLHVVVLACSRASDAGSLDALRERAPAVSPHWRYAWPIRLMAAITVLTYVLAGIAKLRAAGFAWITSDALLNFVAYDNVRKIELGAGYSILGGLLLAVPWLFRGLAALSLVLELGAPLALLGRRIAHGWVLAVWTFHLGVLLMMFIFFPYQLLGFAYLCFFEVERLWPARWRARPDGVA